MLPPPPPLRRQKPMTDQRFKPLSPDEMSPEQRRPADSMLRGAGQWRGGPFSVFLHSPATGDAAQRLGEQVRFRNSLPEKLKELAILVVARHWTAQYEWYAHHRFALAAGLDPAIAAAIAAGKRPAGLEAAPRPIYDFATELPQTKARSPPTSKPVASRVAD